MSISVPVSYLYNRNDKFEVFLRRCLTQEQFERIRGYERCIVSDGKKLSRAFCYYVISDQSIFITENPPKSILINILLTELTHCEIIDDFPDFLDGTLTTLSTHVQLRYQRAANKEKRRRSRHKSLVISDAPAPESVKQGQSTEESRANTNIFANIFSKSKSLKTNNDKSTSASAEDRKVLADSQTNLDENETKEEKIVSEEEAKEGSKTKDEMVVDVHFLTNITPICLLTKITWSNCLITNTLTKDPLYATLTDEHRQTMAQLGNINSLLLHFDLSMRDLVTSINAANLEDFVKLAVKFNECACHSYAIRRIFWRTPANIEELTHCAELFAKEMGLGLPQTRNLFQNAWQKNVYNLRVECLMLTVQLLATFFNETEILKSRTTILEETKYNVVNHLINMLCDAVAYTTQRLLFDKGFQTDSNDEASNLRQLFDKLLRASAALLYEIILSGQAIVHPSESAHFYNVGYLVEQFEQAAHSVDAVYGLAYDTIQSLSFIPATSPNNNLMLNDVTTFVPPPQRPSRISPGRAVQTYRQLFLLDVLTFNSPVFLQSIRQKLSEEFKYFVNMQTASARVPSDYSLAPSLLNLLELVRNRVLVKQTYEQAPLNLAKV